MAAMSHVQGKQIAYGKLCAVSLGGGHGYLGAGPGIYDILALVGDGAAHYVYYGQHVGAALFRLAQGKEGIYGLAGLAYDYGYGPVSHYGIGIAELRCQLHRDGYAGVTLDVVLRHLAYVACGAAGHYEYSVAGPYVLRRYMGKAEVYGALLYTGADGVAYHVGLLHYLLEHEVGVAALFGGVSVPLDMLYVFVQLLAVAVVYLHAACGKHSHVIFVKAYHLAGVLEYCRHV